MITVGYETADAVNSRGPSPKIWADCPVVSFQKDPSRGIHKFDDFKNSSIPTEEADRTAMTSGIANVVGDINWYAFIESASTADLALQADDDGVLMMDQDGTNDVVDSITTGNNVQGVFKTGAVKSSKKWWFEVRAKLSTITDGDLGTFIGLAAPGEAKTDHIQGVDSALQDVDYIGFHIDEADGDAFDIVYNEATSGTAVAVTGKIAVSAADAYFRLGMKYDPNDNKVHCYLDGVEVYSYSTDSIHFPTSTDFDILINISSGSGGADGDNIKIDWVRYGVEY